MQDKFAPIRSCVLRRLGLLLVTSMALVERQSDLHENLPYEVFIDFLFSLLALLDELGEIAAFAVLHHNIESGL